MKSSDFSIKDLLKTAGLLAGAFLVSSLLRPLSGSENNSALVFVLAVV